MGPHQQLFRQKTIIDKAKEFSKDQNLSLSVMIDNYLEHLSKEKSTQQLQSPSLDILPVGSFQQFDYSDYLINKHK